jgi:hypothetical protein
VAGGTVSGSGTYVNGTAVTATTNQGYQFVNWTDNGNQVSTSASSQFIVTGSRNLVANFALSTNQWINIYSCNNDAGGYLKSTQLTSDGGYILAGRTYCGADWSDFWVLQLDSTGNELWQKTYGGAGSESASSIQNTSDGGYIVAGDTNSFGAGDQDALLLKLDSSGNVIWQKIYGGSSDDTFSSIQQTTDGGHIVAGSKGSVPPDDGFGLQDLWVLKLDSTGKVVWQNIYGESGMEKANSIQQTSDGGYIVAGITVGSFNNNHGPYYDIWLLKLDSSGNVLWQKVYGGSYDENIGSIQQTSDGGYILTGDIYNSSEFGSSDIWEAK